MSINGNNQVHSYNNETGCIYVMGNNNTINLKQCQAIINVMGNSNTFNMLQSMVESNVNGNGNNFMLIGSAIKIGVNGNGNIVRNGGNGANGEMTNVNVLYNNGTNNLLDGGSMNNQGFLNVGSQANNGNYNYGQFNAPQQQQRQVFQNQQQFRNDGNGFQFGQNQLHFRNDGNGFQFGQMQYSPHVPNQGQNSYQINLSNQWSNNPRPNNNSFSLSYNNNGNNFPQQPQRGHYSFSYSPTFSFNQNSAYSFNGRQPEQASQHQGLSQSEISLLPVIEYTGASQKCSICLQEIKRGNKVVYLFCFHNFHEECGVDWFRRSATCPLCQLDIRQQIRESQ